MILKLLKMFSSNKKKVTKICNKKKKNENDTQFIKNNKNYIVGFFIFAILLLYSKAALVIPIFIVLAALSRLPSAILPFVSGFDLCLFLTVIAGVAYGSFAGLIVGIGSEILGAMIKNTRNMGEKMIFYIMMGVAGLLAPHIPLTNIFYIGIISTIIYDAAVVFVYFGMIKKCIINATTFAVTHMAFNFWLFSTFGTLLLSLL